MFRLALLTVLIATCATCTRAEESGADPFKLQVDLCAAISAGDVKAVAAALDKGAHLDRDCPEQMSPPLHHAVDTGKTDVVTLLLDRGADVNQKDNGVSATPIHYAAAKHDPAMVKLLAKRGGNVNAFTDEGLSPLAFVILDSDDAVTAQALLDAGADVNAVNEQGDTLLDTALAKGHKKVTALLESKGGKRGEDAGATGEMPKDAKPIASPSVIATVEQQAALHAGISKWDVNAVAAALRAGAQPNQPDPKSKDPFIMYATYAGDLDVLKLLLDNGADINAVREKDGQTALFAAINDNKPETVAFVIAHGADVNHVADKGLAPLAFAVKIAGDSGIGILKALLDAGADPNAKDELGKTALDLAVEFQHTEVAAFLESQGGKIGGNKPAHVATPVEMAGENRTKEGRLVFKGLYLGMPLRDAVERFRALGFPPDEFPDQAIGKRLDERIIVRNADGSLVVRRQSFMLNGWLLQADADGRVTRIVIAAKAVNTLFGAENAADQEFFGGFVKGYGLENGLHPAEVKVWSDVRVPELHAPENCGAIEYIDPSGWYITINDFRDIDYGLAQIRPAVKFD